MDFWAKKKKSALEERSFETIHSETEKKKKKG